MFGIFNKTTDPVCKMKVDKKTKYFSQYKGEKFYFCSENCKKSFDEEPGKYVVRENTPVKSCCQPRSNRGQQNTKSCC